MELSQVAQNATPSATLSINSRAKELEAQGEDVVKFTVGEPDFDTPENIKQAAHRAIQAGFTKYTPAAGMPELRRAIADKLHQDNGLDYEPDQVLVSNGGKQTLYMLMLSLVEDGDDVLLPAPYWVSYPEQARICGANPVAVDCTQTPDLKLTADLLEDAITVDSKLLVLNSPCNPSGAVLDEQALREIVDVAVDHDLWIICDEIYEKLIYDGLEHASPAGFGQDAYEHVLTVNGVSKTYAMTGWRIGYAAGPKEVIQAASRMQSNMTSGPNSIAQKAALEAIVGKQDSVGDMRDTFLERREVLMGLVDDIPGISCTTPQGAFYAFPNISELLGSSYNGKTIDTCQQFAQTLIEDFGVAAVPGAPVGADGFLRLSYAVSDDEIKKGLERLADFASALQD